MNVFLSVFMAVCFLPILIILYFTLRNETKPKNNLILSTTLPREAWDDDRVLSVCRDYKKRLGIAFLVLFLLYLPSFAFSYMSVLLSYLMTWLLFVMLVPYMIYAKYVGKMRKLKEENWYHPELKKVMVFDTSSSVFEEKESRCSFASFLLPLIVSLIPLLFPLVVELSLSPSFLTILACTNAACILTFYVTYRYFYRRKSDRINSDPVTTKTLTRIRLHYHTKLFLMLSWLCALYSFSGISYLYNETLFLIFTVIFTLAILAIALGLEIKIRSVWQHINRNEPTEILADEDDAWLWGLIYYNKADTNTFVNNRVGMGSTLNTAKPFGKAFMIFSAILLFTLPVWGLVMIPLDFNQVELTTTATAVEAHHTGLEYAIAYEDIVSCTLLEKLPNCSRNFGTGMEHVYKGDYSVKDIDHHSKLCLNPKNGPYLLITTSGQTYIINDTDAEDTRAAYEIIMEHLK